MRILKQSMLERGQRRPDRADIRYRSLRCTMLMSFSRFTDFHIHARLTFHKFRAGQTDCVLCTSHMPSNTIIIGFIVLHMQHHQFASICARPSRNNALHMRCMHDLDDDIQTRKVMYVYVCFMLCYAKKIA